MSATDCSTVLRSFTGPEADELAILAHPTCRASDPAGAADATYRALAATLSARGASFGDVTRETLFLRDVRRDLPAVLDARARALAALGTSGIPPRPAFIEQPPAEGDTPFAVLASAMVPRDRSARSVRDVGAEPHCPCAGCAASGARVVRLGAQTSVHTSTLHGSGADACAEATAMFRTGARLLERCGSSFRDVVRAWIQLRDIDRDYDALNEARRGFFRESGLELRPASTGVGGAPLPAEHRFALVLHALAPQRDVTRMSTPLLNEAWSYGADFSRGLRVTERNRTVLHVSGTASIDEAGHTLHRGDFAAQAERMLDNIVSLLEVQGATFADVLSGVTYLKRASDAGTLRAIFARRGFADFPCAVVVADLCRPELLCETEVEAVLPPAAMGA